MAASVYNENMSNFSELEKDSIYDAYKKVYYSDVVGSPILDAVTGAKYPFRVGSHDEKKFFKVRSTIAYKNRSAKTPYPPCASVTNQAFYENPQSYMQHHKVVLSEAILDNWNKRNMVATD
jgi:hypothetical protein